MSFFRESVTNGVQSRVLRPNLMRRSVIKVVMLNRDVKCNRIVVCFVADRADVFFSPQVYLYVLHF